MSTRLDDFRAYRNRMNERILGAGHLGIKRFFNLDTAAYSDAALPARTKELLGLVASAVLRCNDCIDYHLIRCAEAGFTDQAWCAVWRDGDEQVIRFGVALLEPNGSRRWIDGRQCMEPVKPDLLGFEHLYDRRAQFRPRHWHRLRLGSEKVHVHALPAAGSPEVVGDQHGPLVRRAGALVGHGRHHASDSATGEGRQGGVEAGRALKCVERL